MIPVSKLKGADTYYHYNIKPELEKLLKEYYKGNPDIELDFYSPLGPSAWCGLNTMLAGIVLYGKKSQDEMEKEAEEKANRIIQGLPGWIDGAKLNVTRYKDTVLETSGNVGVGFLWRKGAPVRKLKESQGVYGYERPKFNTFWHSDEWNDKKTILHPQYKYISWQKVEITPTPD